MSERFLKLCRNLVGVALVMRALAILFFGQIGIDSLGSTANLVYAAALLLLAAALFSSHATFLALGCGANALCYALLVISYLTQSFHFSAVLWEALLAVSYIVATVSLLRKKENTQLLPMAFVIGVAGTLLGSLLNAENTFAENLSLFAGGASSLILSEYLPILLGVLVLIGNSKRSSANSDAESLRDKTLKLCSIFAAAILLQALSQLTYLGYGSLSTAAILIKFISCLLLAVGLFVRKRTPLAIGCGVSALYFIVQTIQAYGFPDVAKNVLIAVGLTLLAVSVLQKANNTTLPLVAFTVCAVGCAVGYLFSSWYTFAEKLIFSFSGIADISFNNYLPVLVGLLAVSGPDLPVSANSATVSPIQIVSASALEKVMKLKELLDMGIITQEEFDEKKKELLGL